MPDYSNELFCAQDGGGGPYWVTAEGRSATEALAIVESVDTAEDGASIERTTGRIEETGDGPRIHIDEDGDGPIEFWAIEL